MDDVRLIKCPKCGKTVYVEIEDVMDISVEDGNHMTRWCAGQCPACKASLDWNERFEFVELTEVNDSEYDFFGEEDEDEECDENCTACEYKTVCSGSPDCKIKPIG